MEVFHRELAVNALQMVVSIQEANFEAVQARLDARLYFLGTLLGLLAILLALLVQIIRQLKNKVDVIKIEREKLESVIDASPEPLLLCSTLGKILRCNSAASTLLGIPAADILGSSIGDRFAEKTQIVEKLQDEALLRSCEEISNLRLTLIKPDDARCPVELRCVVVPPNETNRIVLIGLTRIIHHGGAFRWQRWRKSLIWSRE